MVEHIQASLFIKRECRGPRPSAGRAGVSPENSFFCFRRRRRRVMSGSQTLCLSTPPPHCCIIKLSYTTSSPLPLRCQGLAWDSLIKRECRGPRPSAGRAGVSPENSFFLFSPPKAASYEWMSDLHINVLDCKESQPYGKTK